MTDLLKILTEFIQKKKDYIIIIYYKSGLNIFPCFSFPDFHCNKCMDRATTVDAVVGPGRKPTVSAVSKWEYFNGFSDDNWWFVNPEV